MPRDPASLISTLFARVLPAALWLLLAAGCGNKGELVMPDAPPPIQTEDADSESP